jgi:hypothetical protein
MSQAAALAPPTLCYAEPCQTAVGPLMTSWDAEQLQQAEDVRDARRLAEDTVILRAIAVDLGTMIVLQGEVLKTADVQVETAEADVSGAVTHIAEAKKKFFAARVWKATLLALGVGLLVGFPVGAGIALATQAPALGAGIAGAVVGGGLGAGSTYAVTKARAAEP